MSAEPAPRPQRSYLRRAAAIVLLVAAVAGALYWRITAPKRLIREIEASGGCYHEFHLGTSSQRIARLLSFEFRRPEVMRDVGLAGKNFDDAWLADHDALDQLRLTGLTLSDTAISRDALGDLLRCQQLFTLAAPDVPITDAEVDLLNQQANLLGLDVGGSQITDAGLGRLAIPRLNWLNVRDAPVSAAGLIAWLPQQPSLFGLVLDGRQFTPELANVCAATPRLKELHLHGPEVTDSHLDLVSGVPSLRQVRLDATSVSRPAVGALCAAHPQLTVRLTTTDGKFEQVQPTPIRQPSDDEGRVE